MEQNYLDKRIKARIFAKQQHLKSELKHYFNHRHIGFSALDTPQVYNLIEGIIRDLKVWNRINELTTTEKYIK